MKIAYRSRTSPFSAALVLFVISVAISGLDAADEGGDIKRLQGRWKVVSSISNGRVVTKDEGFVLGFDGDELFFINMDGEKARFINKFSVDETKSPKVLTYWLWNPHLRRLDDSLLGRWAWAYSLDGDTLKLCHSIEIVDEKHLRMRVVIPTTFSTKEGDGKHPWILKRIQENASPNDHKDSSRSQSSPSNQPAAEKSTERPSTPKDEGAGNQFRAPNSKAPSGGASAEDSVLIRRAMKTETDTSNEARDSQRIQGVWKTVSKRSKVDSKEAKVLNDERIVFQGNRVAFIPKDSNVERETFSLIEQSTPKVLIVKIFPRLPRNWEERPPLLRKPRPQGAPSNVEPIPFTPLYVYAYSLNGDTLTLWDPVFPVFLVEKNTITKTATILARNKGDAKFIWVLKRATSQTEEGKPQKVSPNKDRGQ